MNSGRCPPGGVRRRDPLSAGDGERVGTLKLGQVVPTAGWNRCFQPLSVGVEVAEDLHFHGCHPVAAEAETVGATDREVNDAATDVGAAVGDLDDFGLAVALVGHADHGAQGQRLVGSRGSLIGEPLAACSAGPAIGSNRIPRGLAMLDGFDCEVVRLSGGLGSGIPGCRTTGKQ